MPAAVAVACPTETGWEGGEEEKRSREESRLGRSPGCRTAGRRGVMNECVPRSIALIELRQKGV